jgi:hypothetical protein
MKAYKEFADKHNNAIRDKLNVPDSEKLNIDALLDENNIKTLQGGWISTKDHEFHQSMFKTYSSSKYPNGFQEIQWSKQTDGTRKAVNINIPANAIPDELEVKDCKIDGKQFTGARKFAFPVIHR